MGTSSSDSSASSRHELPPRNGLLKAAVACFLVGVVAVVAIFLTPVVTDGTPGLVLYLLTLAWPLGFVLAIMFALRSGRRARNGESS
ncbi:hypothetical protein [Rhodococcus chondri]|uniref:Integral membrane protein n=1 Tax=Rhodococcus chondri TaxID=3065941 RepID=A0ABU7JTL7_9NOCA|nr:hypothetical protein [Rhodococcus sp. CC-R104]MEE2032834.1 hypothetical protein [Rhodococcus sp. CC-R104]